MNYIITENNLHIEESYKASKYEFEPFLLSIKATHSVSNVWLRGMKSLCREWACHNLLYALHMFRSRTADVDLDYPQKWHYKLVYTVFGSIALLLIK